MKALILFLALIDGGKLENAERLWNDCDMGYGVGVYWYGDAVTTSNRLPDPAG